ncbi:hypothetical protein Slin15195_G056900 [Septoria linicola]|uniref:Uncharacterized protein n=1 Tax=Septoria linicola TaxID=215465 RepID=A0A9Q9AUZ8_9PEZI|nr:hypothetical protein Slin14017_G072770 [Septoria linicola]USW52371.1 hypothetical protein Slin15195_G056900 [Septoria linicola]
MATSLKDTLTHTVVTSTIRPTQWDFLTLTMRDVEGSEPTGAAQDAINRVSDSLAMVDTSKGKYLGFSCALRRTPSQLEQAADDEDFVGYSDKQLLDMSTNDVRAVQKRDSDLLVVPDLAGVMDNAIDGVVDDVKPWLDQVEAILKMTGNPAVRQMGLDFLEKELEKRTGIEVDLSKALEKLDEFIGKYGPEAGVFVDMLSTTLDDVKDQGLAKFLAEQLKTIDLAVFHPANKAVAGAAEPKLGIEAIEFLIKHPEAVKLVADHPEALEFLMKHPKIIKHVVDHPGLLKFIMSHPGLIDWIIPGTSKMSAEIESGKPEHDAIPTIVEGLVARAAPSEEMSTTLVTKSIVPSMPTLAPAIPLSENQSSIEGQLPCSTSAGRSANDHFACVTFFLLVVLVMWALGFKSRGARKQNEKTSDESAETSASEKYESLA